MKCISPLLILCSPLVLLRPAFSQCQGTWSIDINKSDYKDFSRCNLPRSTSSGDGAKLIWKVTGCPVTQAAMTTMIFILGRIHILVILTKMGGEFGK
eukprot:scaffold9252_cov160-Skeletonema_marinoi.AAC.26